MLGTSLGADESALGEALLHPESLILVAWVAKGNGLKLGANPEFAVGLLEEGEVFGISG